MQSCCSPIASASAAAPRAIASIRFNCCSPFASASGAAHHLRLLQLLLSIASVSTAPRLRPLRLLLPVCIRFRSCSPLASASAAALNCVRFNCSSIASASAAAPHLHPLQELLATCICFSCYIRVGQLHPGCSPQMLYNLLLTV